MKKHINKFKTLLLSLLLLCTTGSVLQAQTKTWQTGLPDTYVYKLTHKEAEDMFMSPDKIKSTLNKLLQGPCYTTFRDTWEDAPETGHYILFNILNNRMHYTYRSFRPYRVLLLPVYDSFNIQVVDENGKPRKDAIITFIDKETKQKHRLRYESASKTYTLPIKKSDDFFLITELDGVRSYFDGDTKKAPDTREYEEDDLIKEEPRIYSYLITDKSTYKPQDTIRIKSYILSDIGKPYRKNSTLQIGRSTSFKDVKTITPHRPGSFSGEFVLDNSYDLTLDKSHELRLVDKEGVILATTRFTYEDYQLFDYNLQVDISNPEHFYPDTNYIRIHATDVNNLPLLDTPIEVTILRKKMINIHGDKHHYSLPDTILKQNFITDKRPSTIELPGDIFGNADLTYQVKVDITMPDHRQLTEIKDINFYYRHKELTHSIRDSQFFFDYKERGKSIPVTATLKYNREEDSQTIELPYSTPFDPSIDKYTITVDNDVWIRDTERMIDLKVDAGITDGFFHARLHNPLGIETIWYIYSGEELIKKGSGQDINYHTRVRDSEDNWYVDVFYHFGNKMEEFREHVIPLSKKLRITTDLPERIFPGQEIETTITVKDIKGKPVKNVDITAFAVNGLLNEEFAPLPYYGEIFGERREKDTYKLDAFRQGRTEKVDYETWKKIGALDTLPLYRFLYPEEKAFFIHTEEAPEGITQFAPFVMENGEPQEVQVIECDGKPIWFAWTNNIKSYSFPIEPEKEHSILLRTRNELISIQTQPDFFKPGMKTIFSINNTTGIYEQTIQGRNYTWQTEYKSRYLTDDEQKYYQQYIAKFPVWAQQYYTFLKQGDKEIPVKAGKSNSKTFLSVGPVAPGILNYNDYITYEHEGGYRYDYKGKSVYKYEDDTLVPSYLYHNTLSFPYKEINDIYITQDSISRLKVKPVTSKEKADYTSIQRFVISQNDMDVVLALPPVKNNEVEKVLIINRKDTTSLSNRPPGHIIEGQYEVLALYKDGKYISQDSIDIRPNHYHFIVLVNNELNEPDDYSKEWIEYMQANTGKQSGSMYQIYTATNNLRNIAPLKPTIKKEKEKRKRPRIEHYQEIPRNKSSRWSNRTSYYTPPLEPSYSYGMQDNYSYNITGEVYDNNGDEIIGASIVIKGTQIGAISNLDGKFTLSVPASFGSKTITLVVSFIGYQSKEISAQPGSHVRVILTEDTNSLEEVVVMSYGYSSGGYGSSSSNSSSNTPKEKKEKRHSGSSDEILPLEDDKEEELDTEAERILYYELSNLNRLRSNFSDVGFWQPRLYTNSKGEASFKTTFPDNLTRWDAVVYAMNPKLQTGTHISSIRSYKPLMAELSTPAFLLEGDTAYVESLIRDYTGQEEQNGSIRMTVHNDTIAAKPLQFSTVHQEKFMVHASGRDTIPATFIYQSTDGYMDGEERHIPVMQIGIPIHKEKTKTLFSGDTTWVKTTDSLETNILLEAKMINLYMSLGSYLTGYEYACNEQLSSKLMGLLMARLISKQNHTKFQYDKNINEIIQRLCRNQNSAGLWGWWNKTNNSAAWISNHIIQILKLASDAGFTVPVNTNFPATYSTKMNAGTKENIELLYAGSLWKTPKDIEQKIEQYDKEIADKKGSVYEKMLLIEMRKRNGLPYSTEEVTKHLHSDHHKYLYCYNINTPTKNEDATIIAYRILQDEDSLKETVHQLQYTLLEIANNYRNTYWNAKTILSIYNQLDTMAAEKEGWATLSVSGKEKKEVTHLPYREKVEEKEIEIIHQTGLPVFLTTTQTGITTGEMIEGPFTVRTWFEEGDTLQQGKPTQLHVEVNIHTISADYLMVEVPIPAGCVYDSKPQNNRNETHREYFKEKTVIFFERLHGKNHRITIPLIPHFEGVYHMNPTKVSKMYTPYEFSTNNIRKITIMK